MKSVLMHYMDENLYEGIKQVEPVDSQVEPVSLDGEQLFSFLDRLNLASAADDMFTLAIVWTLSLSIFFALEIVLVKFLSQRTSYRHYKSYIASLFAAANIWTSMAILWVLYTVFNNVPDFAQAPLSYVVLLGVAYKILVFDMFYVLRLVQLTPLKDLTKPYMRALKFIRLFG